MAQVDGTAQKIQSKPARKHVPNVGSLKNQPLAGKSFYLDLPSGKTLEFLEKSLKRFGGVVESFLSKEVTCIISNSQEAQKERWGRKQTAAVLRNTRSGTQTSVGPGRGLRDSSYKPADSVLVTRGKALLQKAIGTQTNTCGSNSVLASARSWGIQIIHTDDMFSYLQWLESKRCRSKRQMKLFRSRPQSALKVMKLQSPFLKVEDESRRLRPFLQQFKNFPELCLTELRRHSPFDPPQSKVPEGRPAHSEGSSDCCLVPKRQRGYCECCEETFVELQMHLQSPQHTAFVLDASHYAPVDSLISQMTNVFAVPSCSSLPLRVPLAASDDHCGFQEDVFQRLVAPSGQPQKFSLSGEGSEGGCPVSPGSSTHWPEDRSFWLWAEFSGETLLTSQSLQLPSGQAGGGSNGAEHHGSGGMYADAPLKPTDCPEVGSWAASQQKIIWAPPVVLPSQPRKRKLSSSPPGQVKKRPMLTGGPPSQLLPHTSALPDILPVDATEGSFCPEYGSRTGPGCLQLSAVPVAKPHQCLRAPSQFPQEGSTGPPGEHVVTDPSFLEWPVQQLEQKEGSAVHPSEEGHAQTPCKSSSADAKLGTPTFPTGTCLPSQLLGSAAQSCSPGVPPSQLMEAVVPAWLGLGLPPLSCSEESSSSESEWDRPLLCALEGASRLPFERPIDSALLGTCVSMQDSSYESHLCSVLWQALEPHEACEGDANDYHGRREALWTPFNSLGSPLDRLGTFFLNEPTPHF